MDEGKGGDQEEAGEDGRQAGLQLPQLPQLLTCVSKPDYSTSTASSFDQRILVNSATFTLDYID